MISTTKQLAKLDEKQKKLQAEMAELRKKKARVLTAHSKQYRKRRAHMLIQLGALLVSQPDIFEALCRRTPEAVGAFERANPDIWQDLTTKSL